MNVQNGTRRQSWRQSGSSRVATGGSLARRRMITTTLLLCLLLGAIAFLAFLFSRRYQHTRLSTLFTASQSNTSEPEQSFTWLPLRFGSESMAPLLEQRTPQWEITPLTTSFDNTQNLVAAIQKQISQLERNDAFILWVRAKGASFADKAYLLSGDYRLPQSGDQISDPQGAVPFKTIVDAVSQWTGPSLILLDWGNQLSDPRAGMWDNQFLYWAVSDIAQAPTSVHCLVSHQAGELSLDSLGRQQTLFGRACAEGLVGPRRAPPDFTPMVQAERSLLVGDLAEYVIRRVWTDSAETQMPWLIHGKVGWVEAERKNWNALTSMPLLQLSPQRRPLGWSDAQSAEPAKLSQPTDSATQPPTPNPPAVELASDRWPTESLWQSLDQWLTPSQKLDGWSLASLAPLTARRMATMTLELECRWLAGNDFRGEAGGANLQARIESLRNEMQAAAAEVELASQSGPFSDVLGTSPDNVSPVEISNWRRRIEAVAAYRRLAVCLSDTIYLSDAISKRDNVSSEFRQAATRAIGVAKSFLQSVTASAVESIDSVSMTDAVPLTRELIECRDDLEAQIAKLVNQAVNNPRQEKPLAELLSRYCWLSLSQRRALLVSMMSPAPEDDDSLWPTKDLSLLQPKPPQLKGESSPQTLSLVEAVLTQRPDLGSPLPTTPEQLVSALCQVARDVRDSNQVSEALWLVVDSRDLCQKESGWAATIQQPPLPSVPQPLPSWRVAWQNAVGGQLTSSRLQFDSTSEPASLDLMLTRVGKAQNIDSLEISLSGVEARLAETDTPWLRDSMILSQADLLRVVDLKANAQRLPIEVKALSNDPSIQREIQVNVRAGNNSPPEQRLTCQLPVVTPVTIVVQQSVCREGMTTWENCPQKGSLFTLHPFPGRRTEFRVLVTNRDQRVRGATVELYRLGSRSAANAKGRIGGIGDEIPLELESQDLRSFASIARSASIELSPNQSDVEVDFSGSAAAPAVAPIAAEPGNSDTATSAPVSSPSDISWGMLAVVRLQSEPTLAWRTWLQIKPVLADDFLSTTARVSSDRRSLELQVGLKDANQNNLADWTPTDFSDEKPIVVQCAVGSGIDMRQATIPKPEQILTKDKPRQTFTVSSERPIDNEVELQMNVDGTVRALFEFVGVGGRAARREPPDRIWLREIGIKDGLHYLYDFKRNLGEKERLLDNYGAMFRRPVPSSIELVLAVDTQSRRIVEAPPIQVDFQLIGPTWEHAFGHFYGERDLQVGLVDKPGTTLKIDCQLSDWKFEFDPRSLGDVTATFRGTAGASGERSLTKLVLDGLGPSLAQSVKAPEIVEGKNGQLRFEVEDSVPIGQGKVLIGPAGKPSQAAPIIEGLSTKDFDPTKSGWQLRTLTLPLQEYAPGRYDLSVQIEDALGNSSTLGPWPLTIRPNLKTQPSDPTQGNGNPSAQPLKGDINGRLFFGAANKLSPNPVKVSIKDQPDKSTSSSDGKFTLSGIEAGEYTVEAQTQWQGAVYKGEAKVKLTKKTDYQKLVDITLSK